MLENVKLASTQRHQAEPLHNDEGNKVYTGGLVQAYSEVVQIDLRWYINVSELELTEGDTVPLEVPIYYCKGGDGFKDTDNPIGLEYKLQVDKAVDSRLTRLAAENAGFRGSLVCKDGCSGTICKAAFIPLAIAYKVWSKVNNTK